MRQGAEKMHAEKYERLQRDETVYRIESSCLDSEVRRGSAP